ncbi:nucleotide exchange factor SIL1-like [Clytia hemisphaerica]|uniref:Nucleotide exchange factor SIL1 n=1 Tax=Clytia hemisphaerica TaxID=252671 RepID=A0A7M5X7N5_9CNID
MQYLTLSWCFVWTLVVAVAFHHFSYGENDIVVSDISEGVVDGIPDEMPIKDGINSERFIPTHEWQVIKRGQAIPAGLHVRMNFQTGVKEAKLMDSESSEQKSVKKGEQFQESDSSSKSTDETNKNKKGPKIILADELPADTFSNEKIHYKKSHLKQVLHDFKDKIGTKDIEHVTWSDDAKDMLQESFGEEKDEPKTEAKKFRSMDEIKKDLEKNMGWNIKSDVQIMQDIVHQLKDEKATDKEKSVSLDTLEDYVHQVDNGRDLDKIGGLKEVVHLLNDSSEILQEKAANVIGGAAQSNKEVQDAIFKHGGLKFLIPMLDLAKEKLTQKKGLYAVSAVIRGNHQIQNEFVKYGGLGSVLRIIKESESNALKVKAVTMMYDLIVEQNEIMQKLIQAGKMKPGEQSPLFKSLKEAGWCHLLVPMLQSEDYDSKEKVIQALVVSVQSCVKELKNEKYISELTKQLKLLETTIVEEDDQDFKSYLVSLKQQLDENILKQLV